MGRGSRGRPPKAQDGSESALAALGARLRALRKRRELTLEQLSELTGYSCQHLSAVERAQVVPSETLVTACDTSLSANGALITMLAAVIREQARLRHQREAARRTTRVKMNTGILDAGAGQNDLDWERLADASHRPSRVTPAVVEDLEEITDRQRRLYHHLSSAEMLAHVQAHLGLLTSFLDAHQPSPLRRRIASAAAEAAGFAAWLCFDLGDVFNTQRCYRQASAAVAEAADYALGVYIRGYQGMVAGQQEGPGTALAHLDEACGTAPVSLSSVTRAWLTILIAEAMARSGQRETAIASVARSRELLEGAQAEAKEPWMYDFDRGSLATHAGNCHLALNRAAEAAAAFEEALNLVPPSCDRRLARIQLGLARARLATGDGEGAYRLASSALAVFADRGSVVGLREVSSLPKVFIEAGLLPAASALEEQARALQRRT